MNWFLFDLLPQSSEQRADFRHSRRSMGRLVQRFATTERDGDFLRGGRARFRGFLSYPLLVHG
jgi:hypothetical protein